jgi:hypothetical protein
MPRLVMYDVADYGNGGFIGIPSGSNASLPVKNLDWSNAYTAYRAVRDAHISSVQQHIMATHAIYMDSFDVYTTTSSWSDRPISIDISEQNRLNSVTASNNIIEKYFNFFVQGTIFWNQLIPDGEKLTGTNTIEFASSYGYYNNTWGEAPFATPVTYSASVDFNNYTSLTSEIYQNYINSFKEYIFSIKYFIKLTTNSNFEEVELPFDFETPFIPPYEIPSYY